MIQCMIDCLRYLQTTRGCLFKPRKQIKIPKTIFSIWYMIRCLITDVECRVSWKTYQSLFTWLGGSLQPSTGCRVVSLNFIRLPNLVPKDGDSDEILHCCLTSSPNDPDSILLLTRKKKPDILFCRLDQERKRLRWTEMSYSKQLRSVAGDDNCLLLQPTCCNGKVYAWTNRSNCVIQIDIVIKDKQEVVINLLPFVSLPDPDTVFLYKLDMTNMVWVEMQDLKDTVFFVDLACDDSIVCSPAIASEFGGYVHVLDEDGKVMYSFDVKDKTVPLSSIHGLDLPPRSGALRTTHVSIWPMPEFRLQGDHEEDCVNEASQIVVMNNEVEFSSKTNKGHLLDIPFHVLERIMEFCIGLEYLNFRATCKLCRLAALVIPWNSDKRLETYSFLSPWLMVFDKHRSDVW